MKRIPDAQTAAICGLFCGTCTFYPKSCHGCLSDKVAPHCVRCPNGFRECAKKRGITRCLECHEFPCHRLEAFSKQHWENDICHHKDVINNLKYMQEQGIEAWVEKETQDNLCPKCNELIFWQDKNSHKC